MDFETWLAAVDAECVKLAGLGRDDIPDWCYWDSWESGETPNEAAVQALEEAGWTEDMLDA